MPNCVNCYVVKYFFTRSVPTEGLQNCTHDTERLGICVVTAFISNRFCVRSTIRKRIRNTCALVWPGAANMPKPSHNSWTADLLKHLEVIVDNCNAAYTWCGCVRLLQIERAHRTNFSVLTQAFASISIWSAMDMIIVETILTNRTAVSIFSFYSASA